MWSRQTKRQEARAWGVPFLPFDVNQSGAHFRVERIAASDSLTDRPAPRSGAGQTMAIKAIRPPLSGITGVSDEAAREILLERLAHGPYRDVDDLYQRVTIDRDALEATVRAGAFDAVQLRRDALYRLGVLTNTQQAGSRALFSVPVATPPLAAMNVPERFVWDYQTTRMSTLEIHAVDLVRDRLQELGCVPLLRLRRTPRKTRVLTAGLVVGRQRPGTAKGFAFFVIEDGPVRAQVIISPDLWDEQRVLLRDASMLIVDGVVEDTGHQLTLKATRLAEIAGPIHVQGYHFG